MLAQRGPFRRTQGGFANAATQAETTSWQAAVVTNGGAVSAARFTIVNNFIAAEKAAGTWALTDDYWGLWAEDTIGALVSLKQLRMGGSFGAPAFTPSRGYTFDGATNYLNTLFVPLTHAVALTGTNMRVAGYERITGIGYTVGAQASGTVNLQMTAFGGGTIGSSLNYVSATFPIATSQGFTAVSRAGGGTIANGYKNGVPLTPVATGAVGTTLVNLALFIGARNVSGAASSFSNRFISFICVGAPLSDAQELGQYTNVQMWATAIGAQV